MPARFDRAAFERVFSDAHVVDVDLSKWDQLIAVWVLADHFDDWTDRCPLVVVEFRNARNFTIVFPQECVELDSPDHHVQWNIDDMTIREGPTTVTVDLFGSRTSPRLTIECESIEFRRVSHSLLDDQFPGWSRPYSPFARPGIEVIAKMRRPGS